jgi:hypothetical protein
MKALLKRVLCVATIGTAFVACSPDDESMGRHRNGGATGAAEVDAGNAVLAPAAVADVPAIPAPKVGIMGEAEITEFFIKQLSMTDEKGILVQMDDIPINGGAFEQHSFAFDTLRTVRYDYQNMMPSSRDLQVFSQTTAAGLLVFGARLCVTLFNREISRATRHAVFGVDDFIDPNIATTERDRVFDVLIDKFATSSAADLEPARTDMKKVMQDEFDEAVAAGVQPRDALEESCTVLVGSLAPYLL